MTLEQLRGLLNCSNAKIKLLATTYGWKYKYKVGYVVTEAEAIEAARESGITKLRYTGLTELERCVNNWRR